MTDYVAKAAADRAEWERLHDAVLTVGCPYCHVQPGEVCQNKRSGQDLERLPGHPRRIVLLGRADDV